MALWDRGFNLTLGGQIYDPTGHVPCTWDRARDRACVQSYRTTRY